MSTTVHRFIVVRRAIGLLPLAVAFLVICVLTARVCPAQTSAPNLKLIRLQLKWKHQFQFAGYYAAIEQGYYREAGLDVELLQIPKNGNPTDAVLAGNAEFGIATSDLLLRRAHGDPVVLVATIFQHSPMVLITTEASGIRSVHELAGRKVALFPESAELWAYLKSEGVDPDSIDRQPAPFTSKPLIAGTIDAMAAYSTDEPYALVEAGVPYRVFEPRSGGIDFYGDSLFTTEAVARRDPEMVKEFRDASVRGWVYACAHPQEMIDVILTKYSDRHSRARLEFESRETRALIVPNMVELGHINEGRWRFIGETYVDLGMLKSVPSFEGFFFGQTPDRMLRRVYTAIVVLVLLLFIAGLVVLRFARLNRALAREIEVRHAAEAELTTMSERLRELASIDELTGLLNRRECLNLAEHQFLQCRRYDRPLSVAMADIDFFKLINDTHGHHAGDEALRCVAELLHSKIRDADIVGRIGGEEFLIVMPTAPLELALKTAQRLRVMSEQMEFKVNGEKVTLTMSFGVSTMTSATLSLDELIHDADEALYEAKRRGRNRVEMRLRE